MWAQVDDFVGDSPRNINMVSTANKIKETATP